MGSGASSSKLPAAQSDHIDEASSKDGGTKSANSENGETKIGCYQTNNGVDESFKCLHDEAQHFRDRLRIMNFEQCHGKEVDCELYIHCLLKKEDTTVGV